MIKKLYGFLEIPVIYRLAMGVLVPGWGRMVKPLHDRVFNLPARRVLDVGCGPWLYTPEPQGLLVGVDINDSYIRHYTGGFLDVDLGLISAPPPNRRRLGYLSRAGRLPFADGTFDEVRCCGIFHHISDAEADSALKEMYRCLSPGGRMIVIESVWPRRGWSRPLAWLALRLDRGKHVRHQEEILRLFQDACPGHWTCDRTTVAYTGLEYACLQFTKA